MGEKVTGGSAAIAALEAAGVEVVFGIPGVHTLSYYDALHDYGIRHVLARHEQGAGFMADGYARASGKPGVALIITGPGITNVATPVGEAYADSSPVVVLSSQVEREWAGKMRGNLHDLADQSGLMSIVTKKSTSVDEFDAIAQTVYDAIQHSVTDRPRPVHVEVPLDLLSQKGDFAEPSVSNIARREPDAAAVSAAVELLANAERPMIYVGGGAQDAGATIAAIAELLGAPIFSSTMGKGAVAEDHPYALGAAWSPWDDENPSDALIRSCDVVLVIGTKLGAQETRYWSMPLPEKMIRVDADPTELDLNYAGATVSMHADAGAAAESILAGLKAANVSTKISADEVGSLKTQLREIEDAGEFAPYVNAVRDALPRDGIIVHDMTMMSYRMHSGFPAYAPRTYLSPSTYGTLGYSVPAAIGAKIAKPDTAVIAIVGDGGFQFTMQELATAIQFEVGVPIVIFNDSNYTAVEQAMKEEFEGRAMAVELVNPDYVKLAEAYNIPGVRAESPEELKAAIEAALERKGPTIIDTPIRRI